MNNLFKNAKCFKSMFSKLIASFVVIIVIIASFHLVTNHVYTRNMENEITINVSGRFNNAVNEFELYFNEVKGKLLMDFYIEYSDSIKLPKTHDYNNLLMIKDMSKYLLMHKYIENFIVLVKDFDYVITLNGTFERKVFFEHIFESENYSEDFWLNEMKNNFMYKVYPVGKFAIYDSADKFKYQYLMPVVQKNIKDSNFILIVLVDINKFLNDLDPDFVKDFYIYNENKELIYPLKYYSNDEFMREIIHNDETPEYRKSKDGYIFTHKSSENLLTYCKYYPNTVVRQQIIKTNRLLTCIILLSMIISIVLSIYIVKKFNNPVKQMYQLIKQSKDVSGTDRDIIDLKNIKESVAGIINKNTNYIKDIDEKNYMLKSYFYQDRLKNIFFGADEPDRHYLESGNYAVILFKIYYRDTYYEGISAEINKGSYVLKDLIHIYICEMLYDAVTFQMEHDQIVSIVNVNKGVETVEAAVGKIVQKLMTEDEYVYFTVIYSRVYSNSSELHEAYEKVMEMLRYRKLIKRTQILSDNILGKKLDRFYFLEDQQKQFINLLRNGKKDECKQLIDRVFEYNVRKEINEFSMYLLYIQVIDCCSNVLMQLYNDIPEKLSLINDYFSIEKCESVEDYIKRYENVIGECVDYINENQKQSDYIVDYVKNYINENYASDISVDLLADRLKISRTYLSRYFKNNTGMNLSDYLNVYRMKKACVLLQNSFLMVKDIAPMVGIYSISTFLRLFKNYTGKTPNDYRKSKIR